MMRLTGAATGIALTLVCGAAYAQQSIEWKQTTNTPKGLNLPKDVKGDILGIELGDGYAEVKPKLDKLLAESVNPPKAKLSDREQQIADMTGESQEGPMREVRREIRLQTPGGAITASSIGVLYLTRMMKGSTQQTISDNLEIHLSAPPSGQQVLGIIRNIQYGNPADQPRMSELFAQMKAKYKADIQTVYPGTSTAKYRIQFNDGRAYMPAKPDPINCTPQYGTPGSGGIPYINRNGDCDVVMDIDISFGLSTDHIKMVTFTLSDNERTKANLTADFAFFDAYARDLPGRIKGNAPKL